MQPECPGPSAPTPDGHDGAATIAPPTEVLAVNDAAAENPAACRPLISIAPMMDWTDVHFRQLARLLSRRTWLWTEMVVDKTILHTQNLDKFLWFPPEQRPLVLQLGGSDPPTLAAAAAKAAEYGYDEINLNCGCPSDRVAGAGCFGAALMMQPQLVADCMAAMAAAVAAAGPGGGPLPVSVKCRLGVDEADTYGQLHEFVRVVSEGSPVRHFIVHSRKAFLNGLSPHQNRTVPPLRHQWAWALAQDFPHLQFSLNGGLLNCHDARAAILTGHPAVPYTRPQLPPSDLRAAAAAVCGAPAAAADSEAGAGCDDGGVARDGGAAGAGASNGGGIEGVMIGRGAYNDPWGCLADADRAVYGEPTNPAPSRRWVIERYREYAETMVGRWYIKPDGHPDPSIRTLMRPLLNLFHGEPGCKRWKNAVDELLRAGPGSFGEVLDRTLHFIPDHVLDAPPRQPDLAALPPFQLDPVLPLPTSRAGQNQAPPGSKPKRGAGDSSSSVDGGPTPEPCGCAAEANPSAVDGVLANGVAHEQAQQQQQQQQRPVQQEEGCSQAGPLEDGEGGVAASDCAEARQVEAEALEAAERGADEAVAEGEGAVTHGSAAAAVPCREGDRDAGQGPLAAPGSTDGAAAAAARAGGRTAVVAAATAAAGTAGGCGEGKPGRRGRGRGCIVS